MERCVNALKGWTGKTHAQVVYDSDVDGFTHDGLFEKAQGKEDIAVIGFTTDGDVFGGFYSVAVQEQGFFFDDPNIFAFSFQSHGRCKTPQQFVPMEELKKYASVLFFKNGSRGFVRFCVHDRGGFRLGNEKSCTCCQNISRAFEGVKDTTLTGKNNTNFNALWGESPNHFCARLVAVQLG